MQTDMMRSSGNCQGIFDLQKGKEAKTASEVEKRGEWAMAKAQEGTRKYSQFIVATLFLLGGSSKSHLS